MASVLRNRSGLKDKSIGYGNEKALNQLLAHHAVIFSPEKNWFGFLRILISWESLYVMILMKFFSGKVLKTNDISKSQLNIPRDPFADSEEFENYETSRRLGKKVIDATENKNITLTDDAIPYYQSLNPDFWKVYFLSGKYYYHKKNIPRQKQSLKKRLLRK